MLQINDKTFMNLQEAVQWLLDNNALPFQSSANYVANTEIGLGTIINPSPAKVRIGSLIFFADSKVSTVIGVTSNSFIVSDQYNNLVDDIVYISNVSQNESGHLIVTFSNGNVIDAGLIKQVTGMYINTSQHLIVSYNDSSTTDLGSIFNGNVNIDGNFTANSIIENMNGYTFTKSNETQWMPIYVGAVKNGNKLTLAIYGELQRTTDETQQGIYIGRFTIPASIVSKLYPDENTNLEWKIVNFFLGATDTSPQPRTIQCQLVDNTLNIFLRDFKNFALNTKYKFRYEVTFLLSDNLAS